MNARHRSTPPDSLFDTRRREAYRILQAMYEGALTPDEAIKEWERVRREASVHRGTSWSQEWQERGNDHP